MELTNTNYKSNKLIKENKKIVRKKRVNTLSDESTAKRKGYSRNGVAQRSQHFRPTSKQVEFLNLQDDKSKTIRQALDLLMNKRININSLLDELCMSYPLNWRRVNRRNGLFLKCKIKEIKNEKMSKL